METVEVVIKIPKDMYDRTLCTGVVIVGIDAAYIGGAIIDGTVLPKGHGRLIDADRLVKEERIDLYTNYGVESKVSAISIEMSPTIIEADEEE